jgi:hypothetical protein
MRHRAGDNPAIIERTSLEWWVYDELISSVDI